MEEFRRLIAEHVSHSNARFFGRAFVGAAVLSAAWLVLTGIFRVFSDGTGSLFYDLVVIYLTGAATFIVLAALMLTGLVWSRSRRRTAFPESQKAQSAPQTTTSAPQKAQSAPQKTVPTTGSAMRPATAARTSGGGSAANPRSAADADPAPTVTAALRLLHSQNAAATEAAHPAEAARPAEAAHPAQSGGRPDWGQGPDRVQGPGRVQRAS